MSIWNDVRGQDAAIAMLRTSVRRGRLAHAYAFFGPGGVGRAVVARKLAQCLFCTTVADEELDACGECPACKQMQAGSHPDFLTLKKPAGKRDIPIDLVAGAKERRGREGLNFELAMRPMSAPRRFALIEDADAMTVESANALLKTLEEPPPGAVMVLVARSPDAVLPTINSRVQPLHLAPLSERDVADLLVETQEASRDDAAAAAAVCGGSLDTAVQLLDADLRSLRTAASRSLSGEPMNAVVASGAVIAALDELGGDASEKRVRAEWAVRFVVEELRTAARSLAQGGAAPEALKRQLPADAGESLEILSDMVDRCVTAESAVARMTPVPLALEGLFDDLATLLRRADRPVLSFD